MFRQETRWPWTLDHARALRVSRRRAAARRGFAKQPGDPVDAPSAI
ncbi:hypothetical protein [Streptomyces aquilus]|nr:hypothetical protein [Streptomyces aquilus]